MQRLLEEAQALAEKIGKQTVVVSMKAGKAERYSVLFPPKK